MYSSVTLPSTTSAVPVTWRLRPCKPGDAHAESRRSRQTPVARPPSFVLAHERRGAMDNVPVMSCDESVEGLAGATGIAAVVALGHACNTDRSKQCRE